jgi:hypothetical protein
MKVSSGRTTAAGLAKALTVDLVPFGNVLQNQKRRLKSAVAEVTHDRMPKGLSLPDSSAANGVLDRLRKTKLEAPTVRVVFSVVEAAANPTVNNSTFAAGEDPWYILVDVQLAQNEDGIPEVDRATEDGLPSFRYRIDPSTCFFCLDLNDVFPSMAHIPAFQQVRLCSEFDATDNHFKLQYFLGGFQSTHKLFKIDLPTKTLALAPQVPPAMMEFSKGDDAPQTTCHEASPQPPTLGVCERNTNRMCEFDTDCYGGHASCVRGYCVCEGDYCSSVSREDRTMGVCLHKSNPRAFHTRGHPCDGTSDPAVRAAKGEFYAAESGFSVHDDRSLGSNFDTCFRFGKYGYLRMDYPGASAENPALSHLAGQFGVEMPRVGVNLKFDFSYKFGLRNRDTLIVSFYVLQERIGDMLFPLQDVLDKQRTKCQGINTLGMSFFQACTQVGNALEAAAEVAPATRRRMLASVQEHKEHKGV